LIIRLLLCFLLMSPQPPRSTLFPYTTLFRSLLEPAGGNRPGHRRRRLAAHRRHGEDGREGLLLHRRPQEGHDPGLGLQCVPERGDRKSTRLNSSHVKISYAVFCLKKKNKNKD